MRFSRLLTLSLTVGLVFYAAVVNSRTNRPLALGIFDTAAFMKAVKSGNAIERASREVSQGKVPGKAVRKNVPLPTSNGPTSKPIVRGQSVSPNAVVNAALTPAQREALAMTIDSEIQQLQTRLTELLAIQPRTKDIAVQVDALNDALTAKREAYAVARGDVRRISPAAAESYAATSNPYFLVCRDVLWSPNDPLRWKEQLQRVAPKVIEQGRSVGLLSLGERAAGTGIVVGRNHVITNRHVASAIADFDPARNIWNPRRDSQVTFDKEYALGDDLNCGKANEPRTYSVNGVFFAVKEGGDDLAILLTSRDTNFPPKVVFGDRRASDYAGNMVIAVLGYPGPPDDMTVAEQIQFFRTPKTPVENKVSRFRTRVTIMTTHEAGRSAAAEVHVGLAAVG